MTLKSKFDILIVVLFLFGICFVTFSPCVFGVAPVTQETTPDVAADYRAQEITITGSAAIGQDLEQMFKEALTDAFYKAYAKVYPSGPPDASGKEPPVINGEKDLISLEKDLGVDDYQILRYWSADGFFNLELKISFTDSRVEQPRLNSLGHFPKLSWVYESAEQIKTVNKTNSGLAVNTTRTIEIVASNDGKRSQLIKTELKAHAVSGEQYVIQDGDNLKVAEINKHNFSKLIYKWDKKLPDLRNQYLGRDALYVVDNTGVIRAFDWEKGAERWQLPASKQVVISQLNNDYLLATIPDSELWILNLRGEKLWAKRFDQRLITAPVAEDTELYCLFGNNELKVFDLETGRNISTWTIRSMGDFRNIYLGISGKRLFLTYNDKNGHGFLRTYHRFTGDLLWEVSREKSITSSLIVTIDAVIFGVGNTIEAREPRFGLKLWEEPVYGLVDKVFWMDDAILAAAGNRLYKYNY